MTIGFAVTAIIAAGLGGRIFRWEMFVWSGTVIAWSLLVLTEQHTNQRNRKTIDFQARIIRNQAELLGQILRQDIDGRD